MFVVVTLPDSRPGCAAPFVDFLSGLILKITHDLPQCVMVVGTAQVRLCTRGDDNDAMQMIWHDGIFIGFHIGVMKRKFIPAFADNPPILTQTRFPFNHLAEQTILTMYANRDKIRTGLAVVISPQAQRTTIAFFAVKLQLMPLCRGAVAAPTLLGRETLPLQNPQNRKSVRGLICHASSP